MGYTEEKLPTLEFSRITVIGNISFSFVHNIPFKGSTSKFPVKSSNAIPLIKATEAISKLLI